MRFVFLTQAFCISHKCICFFIAIVPFVDIPPLTWSLKGEEIYLCIWISNTSILYFLQMLFCISNTSILYFSQMHLFFFSLQLLLLWIYHHWPGAWNMRKFTFAFGFTSDILQENNMLKEIWKYLDQNFGVNSVKHLGAKIWGHICEPKPPKPKPTCCHFFATLRAAVDRWFIPWMLLHTRSGSSCKTYLSK